MTTEEAIEAIKSAFAPMVADYHTIGELSREEGDQFANFTPAEVKKKGRTFSAVILEFPLASLDDDRDARAREFFQSRGIAGPRSMPCTFDGKNSHMTKSWSEWFDNANDLAEVAVKAFEAIYQPPTFPEYEFHCRRGIVLEDG